MNNELSYIDSFIECLYVERHENHRCDLFICVYRPPRGNIHNFLNTFNEILVSAYNRKYSSIYVFGDFNVDILKSNDSSIFDFINLMFSFSLFPLITKPTRITDTTATLIDHIWASHIDSNISNFIIQTDNSDHYPVVSQFKYAYPRKSHPVYINKRFLTQTALNNFGVEFLQVDWNYLSEISCSNDAYNAFYDKFNTLFQKHFPLRRVLVNMKQERSPYITPALKKSIREKHRLERLSYKWPQTFRDTYKQYRNKLTSVLRAAKNNYYKNQLKVNQGNPKSHWQSINSILGKKSHSSSKLKIELKIFVMIFLTNSIIIS